MSDDETIRLGSDHLQQRGARVFHLAGDLRAVPGMGLTMAPERDTATRPIRCDCGQVLAHEHANGDVEPTVVGWRWDTEGRAFVRCPGCGRRKRLPLRRVA